MGGRRGGLCNAKIRKEPSSREQQMQRSQVGSSLACLKNGTRKSGAAAAH